MHTTKLLNRIASPFIFQICSFNTPLNDNDKLFNEFVHAIHSIYVDCFLVYEFSEPHFLPHNTSTLAPADSSEAIPTIDALYSPKFPLEVVRTFVMEALSEAVEVNQVHNRDPIGWSNENLFL